MADDGAGTVGLGADLDRAAGLRPADDVADESVQRHDVSRIELLDCVAHENLSGWVRGLKGSPKAYQGTDLYIIA